MKNNKGFGVVEIILILVVAIALVIGEEGQPLFRIWTIYAARHMADQEVRIIIGNTTRSCCLIMDCLISVGMI